THSSAGIPSLLNSPLGQPSANAPPGMAPAAFLPFKFSPRRESVDWRRISAVDVDLVVSQLDVDALQEHIGAVTLCSLDGERCQRCQSPLDPALIKLLRLAQLTVEWLLHCQEVLSLNLRAAEERLVAAGREREQLLEQHKKREEKQEEKAKALMAELKQRKKVIKTQQSLLAPRIISCHKCVHCDKSFLNPFFLQNHMQRRHPDEYQTRKSIGPSSGIRKYPYRLGFFNSLSQYHHKPQRSVNTSLFFYLFILVYDGFRFLVFFLPPTPDSSISERRPLASKHVSEPAKKQKATASAEKKNPGIKKETRAELERSVSQRLESLGVKPVRERDLSVNLFFFFSPPHVHFYSHVPLLRAREISWSLCLQRSSLPFAFNGYPLSAMQVRPRTSSLPSRASQATPAPAVKQPKTPQPAPRTKAFVQPKTSTPNMKTPLRMTPPFSSDEESEEEDSDMEEESAHEQRDGSSGPRSKQATAAELRADDQDDWSDVSEILEIEPRQLHGFKDQNGNIDKGNHNKGRKVETQLAERAAKKPAGGVSILPGRQDEVQELSLTDLEESSDWVVSSLEDKQEAPKPASLPGSGPLRKSLNSSSTSVWGSSTGKGAKSGLTEAGTGSTLKSSLCSLSDISDSEDMSNK
uniref:DAZ interacting zinc finger protein 1 n=1 Tax=Fundulus heteroclitus TaxID=8078 RepID=A0A3Q2QN61_FUNHE